MDRQKIVFTERIGEALSEAIAECGPDRLFVLVDETTERLCLPVVSGMECLRGAQTIVIAAGDNNKTLQSVSHVWDELQRLGATRHSLLINLGGGMVTDLGGFAASTFKRGIAFINIPTTLLAMVDASVGGKTGINYGGLKNEIGTFRNAHSVIIDTRFLQTLDTRNLLSGYAEMLKHGLLKDSPPAPPCERGEYAEKGSELSTLLSFDIEQPDLAILRQLIRDSVSVKERIVEADPTEQGLRKALNLGHTFGHAFEAFAMKGPSPITHHPSPITHHPSPITQHGYAVAWGLVCELYLSVVKTGFPVDKMRQTVRFIREHYGSLGITCKDYPLLIELMSHDKKNTSGIINFTLLGDIGDIRINQTATKEEIEEALDFYREG